MRPFLLITASLASLAASCAAPRYELNQEDMARFLAAGPITPEFDEERLLESIQVPGPYTLVSGDLLLVRAPAALVHTGSAIQASTGNLEPAQIFARVSDDGSIDIPLAGNIEARGRTVRQVEREIAQRVYPKYLQESPSIVVTVEEPTTSPITIYGAVNNPGIHELTSNRLSLSGALAAAGGIAGNVGSLFAGARKILIYRPSEQGGSAGDRPEVVALPVRGLSIPFYDQKLAGGERIEVERYEPDRFTITGLVASPGAYEYPPETEYNLMQILAIAGGVNTIADPPYATIFRKDQESGEIIPGTFKIKGDGLVAASSLIVTPGDVISIGHTKASWTRELVGEIFRINIGYFFNPNDL
ncbi:MAG: polysaccharide biosynthesis/export family protein [Planctomycetota bacterium]